MLGCVTCTAYEFSPNEAVREKECLQLHWGWMGRRGCMETQEEATAAIQAEEGGVD